MTQTHFSTKSGNELALREWHSVGYGFSVRPLATRYHVRNDATGEVVRPAGPAGWDNLMMALFYGKVPNYVFYAYGREQTAHVPEEAVY